MPAVGERDGGARTLRLQEREGVGGHGEEDLGAVVVDGRTQDFRVGVGLALEGDDDGAGGGDQRAALARREERGSQLVVRGLGVVRSLDAELGPQDLEVAPEPAAQGVVALRVRAERAVRVPGGLAVALDVDRRLVEGEHALVRDVRGQPEDAVGDLLARRLGHVGETVVRPRGAPAEPRQERVSAARSPS